MSTVVLQLLVALGAIVGGAHLFVEQVLDVADSSRYRAVDPLARPRPVRNRAAREGEQFLLGAHGKDSLALGNITGAMVFQSTMPVAIGLVHAGSSTRYSILAGCLALAGGLVAIITLQIRRRFSTLAIVALGTSLRDLRRLRRTEGVTPSTAAPEAKGRGGSQR